MPGTVQKAPQKVSQFYVPPSQSAAWQSYSQSFSATFNLSTGGYPASALVSYWKLDETSGTRLDSYSTNDLSDNNTVGSTTGKIGNAAQFVAANGEFLNHASNAALSMGDIDFTITAWAYFDSIGSGNSIVSKYDLVANQREFAVVQESSTFRLYVTHDGLTTDFIVASSPTISTGQWYFIAAWHDSSANTLNIQVNNGTVYSGSHSTGVFAGTSDFYIGRLGATFAGYDFDGRIDEVGLWKRLLTPGEITALYNGGAGITYTGAPAATLSVKALKNFAATFSSVAALSRRLTRSLTATLSFIGNIATNLIHPGTVFSKSFTATLFSGGTVTFTDNFNRANGSLGSNWTTDSASFSALAIVSNACQGSTGSAHNVAIYNASGAISANQYAQCKVTATGGFIGTVLRSDGAGTFYVCYYSAGAGTIYKWITGSASSLVTGTTITPAVNDVIYFEAVGTTLTFKVNGVVVATGTDGAITGTGYTGIDIYDTASAVDDFQAGPIGGGGGGPSATLTRRTGKVLSATFSPIAALARKVGKVLSATLSFIGAVTKRSSRAFTATLSFIGNLATNLIHGGTLFTKNLAATLSFSGVLATSKSFLKSFTATLSFVGAMTPKQILTRAFTATLNATATLSRSTGKAFNATLSFAASLVRRVSHAFSAILSSAGSLVKAIRDAGFSATLSFAGSLTTAAVHFFTRSFTATLSFVGTISTSRRFARILSATLNMTGAIRRQTGKVFAATLSFSTALRKALRKVFSATLSLIGFLFRGGFTIFKAGQIAGSVIKGIFTGSTAKIAKAGSQLEVREAESDAKIPTTGSQLRVERTK